jgi:hypothetical protein
LTKEKCEEKFKSENSSKVKCVDSDLINEFRKLIWYDDDEDIKGVF